MLNHLGPPCRRHTSASHARSSAVWEPYGAVSSTLAHVHGEDPLVPNGSGGDVTIASILNWLRAKPDRTGPDPRNC